MGLSQSGGQKTRQTRLEQPCLPVKHQPVTTSARINRKSPPFPPSIGQSAGRPLISSTSTPGSGVVVADTLNSLIVPAKLPYPQILAEIVAQRNPVGGVPRDG